MDSAADISVGVVSAEHLKLQTARSSTFRTSIFLLPIIPNLMVYLSALGWADRSSVAGLAIGVVLLTTAFVGAYVFVDDVTSVNPTEYGDDDNSEGFQYLTPPPEAQYVAIIPAGPYKALREQHEVSLSLMFLLRQAADRADAGRIYEKLLLDSVIEAPVVVLCPAALWRLWKQSTFTFAYVTTVAPSESESEIESENSYSELNCLTRLLWRTSDKAVEIFKAFLPLIGACLMLMFLIVPLSHSAINEPGFDALVDTGIPISSSTGAADLNSQPVQGLPTCPQSFDQDITQHYIDQLLWPDVTHDTSLAIEQQSYAIEVFGTVSVQTAASVLFDMNCSVPEIDALAQDARKRSNSASSVVYDAPGILSCACSDASLLGQQGETISARCPTVEELFELFKRAGGPVTSKPLPGIKSMWNLALIVAYTMLAVQAVLILLECTLVVGLFSEEDLYKVMRITVFVSGTLPLVLIGGQMLVQIGFFAVWVHGRGDYAPKELVLGNMCIVKSKNLYAGDISSSLVVLIVAEIVLWIVLRAACVALSEHLDEDEESSDGVESQQEGSNPFVDTQVVNAWLVHGPEADNQTAHANLGGDGTACQVADVEMTNVEQVRDSAPVASAAVGGADVSHETHTSVAVPLGPMSTAERPENEAQGRVPSASSGMESIAPGGQEVNAQKAGKSSVPERGVAHSAAAERPSTETKHYREDAVESCAPLTTVNSGTAAEASQDTEGLPNHRVQADLVASTAMADRFRAKAGGRGVVGDMAASSSHVFVVDQDANQDTGIPSSSTAEAPVQPIAASHT